MAWVGPRYRLPDDDGGGHRAADFDGPPEPVDPAPGGIEWTPLRITVAVVVGVLAVVGAVLLGAMVLDVMRMDRAG